MRILTILDRIPYPVVAGAPLRIYNLLRRIAVNHEVSLISFSEPGDHSADVMHLRELCKQVETVEQKTYKAYEKPGQCISYLLQGKPPELRFSCSDEFERKLHRLITQNDFDVVQIEHSYMGPYIESLPVQMRKKTIWMLHDVDFTKFERIAKLEPIGFRKMRILLHAKMLRRWQPRYSEHFGCCVVVSDEDKRTLQAANPKLCVDVAPNGIDTSAYSLLPEQSAGSSLLFIGNMDYLPNVDAVLYFHREVLPLIRTSISNINFWIVGISPRPLVKNLARDNVHVTGRVEDVIPYYKQASVCVVPLRAGGGTRLKILEAMALGRPVVSSTLGCEGLDVEDHKHLLIADNPQEFADKTIRLLTDHHFRRYIVKNARDFVVLEHDWTTITQRLLNIYASVMQGKEA
jgi:sugar transferase (PEP-CTERM/EpsH1 system associated)